MENDLNGHWGNGQNCIQYVHLSYTDCNSSAWEEMYCLQLLQYLTEGLIYIVFCAYIVFFCVCVS